MRTLTTFEILVMVVGLIFNAIGTMIVRGRVRHRNDRCITVMVTSYDGKVNT